jgi:transcriptional regulator with XRE-family HTH domain
VTYIDLLLLLVTIIEIDCLVIRNEDLVMKTLSAKKLAETVAKLRQEKGLTKEELGALTGINRIMIGRIEREDFMPSIIQFEALGNALGFDVNDMFVEKETSNSFIALRSEALNENEKEGVDILFKMMISLRQQVFLRRKFENESTHST